MTKSPNIHVCCCSGWAHCRWRHAELDQGGAVAPGWTSNLILLMMVVMVQASLESCWHNSSKVCDHGHDHQANPELCSYMGCVGKDDSSKILAEKVSFLLLSYQSLVFDYEHILFHMLLLSYLGETVSLWILYLAFSLPNAHKAQFYLSLPMSKTDNEF